MSLTHAKDIVTVIHMQVESEKKVTTDTNIVVSRVALINQQLFPFFSKAQAYTFIKIFHIIDVLLDFNIQLL